MKRVSDLQAARARALLVGRDVELAALRAFLSGDEPLVMHVHGMAGVGKTALLDAFIAGLKDEEGTSAAVIRVEGRACEPSPLGFAQALSGRVDASPDPGALAATISGRGDRVLLVIDSYESFGLVDAWLRQQLLPALGAHVRTLLAGREPPRTAWRTAPAWQGLFTAMALEPLSEPVAIDYLIGRGVPQPTARALSALTHGHPLALTLGAALVSAGGEPRGSTGPLHQVVDHMASLFLQDVTDPITRRAVWAASLVRTATAPLLAAMLPDVPAGSLLDRLRGLPFVRPESHGLVVHEAVKSALSLALKAQDPKLHQDLRQAACAVVSDQYRNAPRGELWRCTADVLYLIENEMVRGAFFPKTPISVAVESAQPADGPVLLRMVLEQDGPASAAALDLWWRYHPDSFFVARDDGGAVAGFYQAILAARVHRQVLTHDPVAAAWSQDLPRAEDRHGALWLRRSLHGARGEGSSPVRAAFWLDIKRLYLELRPDLRRVYTCTADASAVMGPMQRLGFRRLPQAVQLGEVSFESLMLDMGPDSVDGWLAGVLAAELQAPRQAPLSLLDEPAREVVIEGKRIALTPLELGVLSFLMARPGKVVARHELIESVWGHGKNAATSNVVETVVRSVRHKLGPHRERLETVRGVGYRYRPTDGPPRLPR